MLGFQSNKPEEAWCALRGFRRHRANKTPRQEHQASTSFILNATVKYCDFRKHSQKSLISSMPQFNIAECDTPTGISVADWIAQLTQLHYEDVTMPSTPSPKKRYRPDGDLEETPKNRRRVSQMTLDSASISALDVASNVSGRSASPKKREAQLRLARDFPLERAHITKLTEPTSLMRTLQGLQSEAVIPSTVKVICAMLLPIEDT